MMNIARVAVVTAACLLYVTFILFMMTAGPYVPMRELIDGLAGELELITRSTADVLASLIIVVTFILLAAAAICSVIQNRRRGMPGRAQSDNGTERNLTGTIVDLTEDTVRGVSGILFLMWFSAFLPLFVFPVLFLLEDAISPPVFRRLVYSFVGLTLVGWISGSVWLILRPETDPSRASEENPEAEK